MNDDSLSSVLATWNLRDPERGRRNALALQEHIGPENMRELWAHCARLMPRSPDPDLALNVLERFLAQPAGRDHLPKLFENRGRPLDIMLRLMGNSQFLGDVLIQDPGAIEIVRGPMRRTPTFAELQAWLQESVDAAGDDQGVLRAFRRFRRRQTLRIGLLDIVRERPLDEVTREIARVAEVALEVALATALRQASQRFGTPYTDQGVARVVVIGFGKLGGEELNYSSDIDLMFVYDGEGSTRGRRSVENSEFYGRVVTEVVRLLSSHSPHGQAYRVDLRLRPEGQRGPLARSLAGTLSYYDAMGRTWERQALIKARPVAGDLALGREFLEAVEPFIYRKYFSFSEINEIKALKRKIERKAHDAGTDDSDVKTGRGGIRDIEFAVQFLQLLNGGDLPEVRQRNTLLALQALVGSGCLTEQEYQILDDTYRFLRKTEHRLQLLFDMQTHRLPDLPDELRKLARRMGYSERPPDTDIPAPDPNQLIQLSRQLRRPRLLEEVVSEPPLTARPLLIDPLDRFLHDYHAKTELNRAILDHLLHLAFATGDEEGQAAPESDLILDPQPDEATIRSVLGRFGFRDVAGAYQNLVHLATESVHFLSARRCRHFLASIAPRLLREVAISPDPDQTLRQLEQVTASLGAKAVLWELFSFNPPSLKLYVDLCAGSPFLADILINNPGMIDELLDSLVLNRPRSAEELADELAALCANATDVAPILRSFQDKELLRIGVRDLLGKTPVAETSAALSDLAETILARVAQLQVPVLAPRFGLPCLEDGRPCRWAILALGKLGGREMSYHSDLDLILVYEGEGRTIADPRRDSPRFEPTDHLHYFSELARRIIRQLSTHSAQGRLYSVDMRLRPTGGSGSLATSLAELERYYASASAQLWERQALTKARPVVGEAAFAARVREAARRAAYARPCPATLGAEVRAMRERVEGGAGNRDLKRGFGGLVDVEFAVQMLQLRHGAGHPECQVPSTREALDALRAAGALEPDEHAVLHAGFDFLRLIEHRLRGTRTRASDELPDTVEGLSKLARRLGYEPAEGHPGAAFLADLDSHTRRIREVFLKLCARVQAGDARRSGG